MSGAPPPGRRQAWLALGVLTSINLLNYLDRYVLAAIVPALKASPLALSDFQAGLLQSAFMGVYMVVAPVFGTLGDRGSRTRPIAFGVGLWSLATVLSGLAQSFPQLLAGRAAVGIGEAAYVAIAPALLSDLFAPQRRVWVLSILNMAIPVGSALGYVVGGQMEHAYGWRSAFFVAGLPGLLAALVVLSLRDPPRGALEGAGAAPTPRPSQGFREAVDVYRGLLRHRPYRLTVLGYAAYTFALGGLAYWMPEFLVHVRHIPAQQATTRFGLILVATGFAGTFLGGWLADRLQRRTPQGNLLLCGWATLLAVPCAAVALTAASPGLFYPALIAAETLLLMSTGPVNTAIVNGVSPFARASAVGLSMFLIHLLGDVPSPALIGGLSDLSSLDGAVLLVPVAVAIAGVLWLAAARAAARAADTAVPAAPGVLPGR
jgi:MFS transporter, Spinster family, sphingosine-1-phosphate transporter